MSYVRQGSARYDEMVHPILNSILSFNIISSMVRTLIYRRSYE